MDLHITWERVGITLLRLDLARDGNPSSTFLGVANGNMGFGTGGIIRKKPGIETLPIALH